MSSKLTLLQKPYQGRGQDRSNYHIRQIEKYLKIKKTNLHTEEKADRKIIEKFFPLVSVLKVDVEFVKNYIPET